MAVIAVWIKIDERTGVQALQEAAEALDNSDGEVLLDLSSVLRLDLNVLRGLQEFADIAQKQSVNVVLRGVNVDVYKVLKLVKLAKRLSFVN